MSLAETKDLLPNLQRRPAMTTWKVLDKDNNEIAPPVGDEPAFYAPHKRASSTLWPSGREAEFNMHRACVLTCVLGWLSLTIPQYPHLSSSAKHRRLFRSCARQGGDCIIRRQDQRASCRRGRQSSRRFWRRQVFSRGSQTVSFTCMVPSVLIGA